MLLPIVLNQNVSAKMSIYIFQNVMVVLWYYAMTHYTDKLSHNFIINKTLKTLYGNDSNIVKSAAILWQFTHDKPMLIGLQNSYLL